MGANPIGDFAQEAREERIPSPEGEPALAGQLTQELAGFGVNLMVNGSVESWSSGTSSAPDGWTLTGAGATVARNTTASQIQFGVASVTLTAALNTATDLGQSITISTTQNLRLRGRQVTFSCRVYSATSGRVFLRLDDGVKTADSPFHPGGSAFHTLVITMTLDSAATKIEGSLEISSGASISAVFDGAKLEEGNRATAFVQNVRDPFLQSRIVANTSSITTTSTTPTDMTAMSIGTVILDGTQSVLLFAMIRVTHNTGDAAIHAILVRDSTDVPASQLNMSTGSATANEERSITLVALDSKPSAGSYTYKVQWWTDAGQAEASRKAFQLQPIPAA